MPVKEIKQINGLSTADLLERANKRVELLEKALGMALEYWDAHYDTDCDEVKEPNILTRNYWIEKARTQ